MSVEDTVVFTTQAFIAHLLASGGRGQSRQDADRQLLFCEIVGLLPAFSDESLERLARQLFELVDHGVVRPSDWPVSP